MFFTYILYSQSADKFYIGSTANEPEYRLYQHNNQHKGFTSQANDWKIMWTQSFSTMSEARSMERQIKAWKSRKRIIKLIDN
jgi:putative endonuclease